MTDIESKITEKLKQYGFSVGDLTEEELAALRDEIEAEAQGVIILDGVLFHKDIYRKWHFNLKDFKDAFYSTSGMNEEQVVDMLTYGQGPQIYVEDLSKRPDGTQREAPQGDILQHKESGKVFEKRAYNEDVNFKNYMEIYQNLYAPTKLPKMQTPITTIYYDK